METKLWKQTLIGLIDASIATGILIFLSTKRNPFFLYEIMTTYNTALITLLWFALYRLICIIFFKGTIGMKLFRVRFLTGDLKLPSLLDSALASFFILKNGIRYYDY